MGSWSWDGPWEDAPKSHRFIDKNDKWNQAGSHELVTHCLWPSSGRGCNLRQHGLFLLQVIPGEGHSRCTWVWGLGRVGVKREVLWAGGNEGSGLEVREHSILGCWRMMHGGDIVGEERWTRERKLERFRAHSVNAGPELRCDTKRNHSTGSSRTLTATSSILAKSIQCESPS